MRNFEFGKVRSKPATTVNTSYSASNQSILNVAQPLQTRMKDLEAHHERLMLELLVRNQQILIQNHDIASCGRFE